MPTYSWKGVQDGKYATGRIEGINRDEAAFKVKQQKVIITSLIRLSGVEQKGDDAEGKKLSFNFFNEFMGPLIDMFVLRPNFLSLMLANTIKY